MQSRTRTVVLHVVVVPVLVVLASVAASAWTALQFDVLVFALSVGAVVGWVALPLTDDGPVVTENTDSFGVSRDGAWNVGDPADERQSFSVPYRLYVSLIASAVVGWAVLLVG